MGYMRHHAVVVTSWDENCLKNAHAEASRLGMSVTPVLKSPVNCYFSFMVAPDGSKAGWVDDKSGDEQRAAFRVWLDIQRYTDGGGPLAWAEVQYGDDDGVTAIIAHSDEAFRQQPGALP